MQLNTIKLIHPTQIRSTPHIEAVAPMQIGNTITIKLPAFTVISCFVFCALSCAAQLKDSTNLPGHQISNSEVLAKNPLIATATLKSNGRKDLGSVGRVRYSYVSLSVEEILTGEAPNEIIGTYMCITAPDALVESLPTVGERYIIFFERSHHDYPGQTYTILRFLTYTSEEVNRLKKKFAKSK